MYQVVVLVLSCHVMPCNIDSMLLFLICYISVDSRIIFHVTPIDYLFFIKLKIYNRHAEYVKIMLNFPKTHFFV